MRKRAAKEEKRETKKRLTGLAAAAKAFEGFRPATEVLKRVRAVPTRFVQFAHATDARAGCQGLYFVYGHVRIGGVDI